MAIDAVDLIEAYRRLERPLYNLLYRMLWNPSDCQDLMHEAFERVWARRERTRAEGLDALLYASALNLARNRLRWGRLRRWVGMEALDAEPAPDDPCSASERAALRGALAGLPASMRDVLLLTEFGGLGQAEVASLLGIPEGTVASRRHHALRRLRHILGEERDDS